MHMPCQGGTEVPSRRFISVKKPRWELTTSKSKQKLKWDDGVGARMWFWNSEMDGLRPEFHDFHHFRRLQALGKASEGVSSPTVEQ